MWAKQVQLGQIWVNLVNRASLDQWGPIKAKWGQFDLFDSRPTWSLFFQHSSYIFAVHHAHIVHNVNHVHVVHHVQ